MNVEPVDVLAFSPHPDDAELGCGGTLAALSPRGLSFGIVDLTRGEMATRGTPEIRAREAREAARILGARFRETLDLGDGGLRTDRAAELRVVEAVRRARPRVVLAPLPADRHPDHARAGRLVPEAAWYAGLAKLETELSAAVNLLGVGPQGLGGDSTAFAVHVELAATHITMNPVAVNMQCHSARRASAIITDSGVTYGF